MNFRNGEAMTELIPTINNIVKYGLDANLSITDKEKLLERDLIKIYSQYFDIDYQFDETNYEDFDNSQLPDIRQMWRVILKTSVFTKALLILMMFTTQRTMRSVTQLMTFAISSLIF